jgi:hypothetical protein
LNNQNRIKEKIEMERKIEMESFSIKTNIKETMISRIRIIRPL